MSLSLLKNRFPLVRPVTRAYFGKYFRSNSRIYRNHSVLACFSESEFHQESDNCLEKIVTVLESIEDKLPIDDLQFDQGVLTINLGVKGTWVLNKQTPNRQIWWSSPLSGPRRYEFKERKWISTKDGQEINDDLAAEMSSVLGEIISFY
jgi:frataxin